MLESESESESEIPCTARVSWTTVVENASRAGPWPWICLFNWVLLFFDGELAWLDSGLDSGEAAITIRAGTVRCRFLGLGGPDEGGELLGISSTESRRRLRGRGLFRDASRGGDWIGWASGMVEEGDAGALSGAARTVSVTFSALEF